MKVQPHRRVQDHSQPGPAQPVFQQPDRRSCSRPRCLPPDELKLENAFGCTAGV